MKYATFTKLTVAIDFDDNLPNLMSNSIALARQLGAELRLVHVVDPWDLKWFSQLSEFNKGDLTRDDLEQMLTHSADAKLRILKSSIPDDLAFEALIRKGDVVDQLVADMEENGSDILITSVSKSPLGEVSGLSKALDFAKDISLPVLILDREADLSKVNNKLKLCIADDLGSSGFAALRFGQRLACNYDDCYFVHAHVASQIELGTPTNTGDQIKESLEERASHVMEIDSIETMSYQTYVSFGHPELEMKKVANAAMADVAIFGHHQILHRGSHRIGDMSHRGMLQQHRAVLIVPEIHSV